MKKIFIHSKILWIGMASVLIYAFHSSGSQMKAADTVATEAGLVSGKKSESSEVIAYKGIPFAAPPIGELRWKKPQPTIPWKGVKKCEDFGPSPMQSKPVPFIVYTKEFLIPEKPVSEDCLYLQCLDQSGKRRPRGQFLSGFTVVHF